jgi:hypothetical protein
MLFALVTDEHLKDSLEQCGAHEPRGNPFAWRRASLRPNDLKSQRCEPLHQSHR